MVDTPPLDPLPSTAKLVNEDGTPTEFFQRKWAGQQQLNVSYDDLIALIAILNAEVDALQALNLTAGTGLNGGGNLTADRAFDLANTAVTAAAYLNANITIDAQGRITAAANGSSGTLEVQDESVTEVAAATILNFLGAGVTVADAGSGEAEITIPGGGGGTPVYVGDGRFSPPQLADFPTWVNQLAAVATYDDAAGFSIFDPTTDTGGDNFICRVKTMPSGTWTATMKFQAFFRGLNYNGAGFIMRDSSTNRNIIFRRLYNNGIGINVAYYNNNTFNTTVFNVLLEDNDFWWQVEDDATNFMFRISGDGINWQTVATVGRTAWLATPDQIGFMVNPENDPGVGINVTYYDDKDTPAVAPTIPIALGDLSDVVVPAPADLDLLQWDNGTTKWVNVAQLTYANIQDVAANKLLGRAGSGSGVIQEINLTAAGRALIDDADAAAQRTTLGLGTAAVEATGTSGAFVPLLSTANTWSLGQTITVGDLTLSAGTLFIKNQIVGAEVLLKAEVGDASGSYFTIENSTSAAANFAPLFRGRNVGTGTAIFLLGETLTASDAGTAALFRFDARRTGGQVVTRPLFSWYNFTSKKMEMAANGGLVIGPATGGSKGAGTLNAQAVYDDGVLLTCYPLEAHLDGVVALAEWDARVLNRRHPRTTKKITVPLSDGSMVEEEVTDAPAWEEVRKHEPAGRFALRADRDLDPELFWEDMVTRRALPAMPTKEEWAENGPLSVGDISQRLWETIETMVIHAHKDRETIKELRMRIEKLE